jgi:lipopolysaccharide transport system ATP-binding protein
MSEPIISVENLSKRYLITHQATQGDGLRHVMERALRNPLSLFRRAPQQPKNQEEFWALRNINLSIHQGEVVGIIGRNGAGKSTFLKILSRIAEPTTGRIRLRGRVASLLEVGTGFHPELTGRENIFLNGVILGMTRAETRRKFDEIVAFSGVERFLDTPVKRYSSGMYVRLAFAVAAHLEPEILVVDEVLAVGDAEFQAKCLGKMSEVASCGRTVLFVSHNMQAVTRLCSRCVFLDQGEIRMDGNSNAVANSYLNSGLAASGKREWGAATSAPGDEVARLVGVRICAASGEVVDCSDVRHPVVVEIDYIVAKGGQQLLPHFSLRNQDGVVVFVAVDLDPQWRGRRRPSGRYVSRATIPGNFLSEGLLSVQVVVMSLNPQVVHAKVDDCVAFRMVDDLTANDTARGDYRKPMPGVVRPSLEWTTRLTPAEPVHAPASPRVSLAT